MDNQYMDSDLTRTSKSEIAKEFSSVLEFLVKIKSFIDASNSTESYLTSINEGLRCMTLHESDLENNIPTSLLWKCFNQVGVPKKIKKYVKLLLELFIMNVEKNMEDNQKWMEWYNHFIELKDCIFLFCSKKEYANDLKPIIKSFVDILLKKIREIDRGEYPKKVYAHNFFEFIVTEFFRCRTLTNSILEEIIRNSHDVIQDISSQEVTCLPEETVNAVECLNRYLNIVEIENIEKIIDPDKIDSFELIFKKLMKIEALPKYFLIRVAKLLNVLRNE